MSLRGLTACLLIVALPLAAAAQRSQSITGKLVFVGDERWIVTQTFGPAGGYVEVRGPNGATRGRLDAPGWMACAAGADGILVAVAQSGPPAVRAAFVPVDGGYPGAPRFVDLPRSAGRDFAPVGVAVTRRPDGFAILWQEGSTRDPNATWQTYEARLDPRGAPIGAPRHLARVPWPIADATWADGRYFLLLYFGSASPERTRFAAVHVSDEGLPQEHPWWATREGLVGEAQLAVAGERVHAVYRGGANGDQLLEADVTSGSWGREVEPPRSHGTIRPDEAYGVRAPLRVERVDLRRLP